MNKNLKKLHNGLARLAATCGVGASLAQGIGYFDSSDRVYVIDQRGEVAMSGFGLCWRTGFWTPAVRPTIRPAASATRT